MKKDWVHLKKHINPAAIFLFPDEQGNFLYHLGVGYILAYLKGKGIIAESFVSNSPLRIKDILTLIKNKHPRFLGFTCFNANYFLVKIIAEHIKKVNPGVQIIAGGPSATFYDKEILRDSKAIDICVRGEGEETVYQLLSSQNSTPGNILGVTYRSGEKIICNPDRIFINDLDAIPSPYFSEIIDPIDLWKINREIPILTSRGCIYRCTYCNFSAMSRYTIRYHSTQRVINELQTVHNSLSKHGLTDIKVMVQDDVFTLDRKRVEEICSLIKQKKINLRFWLLTRADTVDKDILRILFSAGFRDINFGLESANHRILYNVKKAGVTNSDKKKHEKEKSFIRRTKENIIFAKKIGFKVGISVIFGLPGETLREGTQTLNFVRKLDVDTYAHNYLSIFKGTELFSTYRNYGLKLPKPSFQGIFNDCLISPPKYRYNIFKLPLLKNEIQIGAKSSDAISRIINFLSGWYDNDGNGYTRDIMVLDKTFPREWTILNHTFKTRFIYGRNLDNLLEDKGFSKITLMMGTVSSFAVQYKLSLKGLMTIVPDYLKFEFTVDKFSAMESSPSKSKRIVKILDAEDMRYFLNRHPIRNYILLDACRWSNHCPAMYLKRLIIKANNIFPCFQGYCIGSIKDDLHKIRSQLLSLKEKEERKRGCSVCPENNNCAKCLFLGSMEPATYCQIRKTYTQLPMRITSLRVITKMINYARNQI